MPGALFCHHFYLCLSLNFSIIETLYSNSFFFFFSLRGFKTSKQQTFGFIKYICTSKILGFVLFIFIIVYLQCCASFCCAAKWPSHSYTHTHTRTHIYTHIYTHAHTHTHIPFLIFSPIMVFSIQTLSKICLQFCSLWIVKTIVIHQHTERWGH